jgi:hypothetical protein
MSQRKASSKYDNLLAAVPAGDTGLQPEPSPPPAPAPAAQPEPRTAMTYRPTIKVHGQLRRIGFERRRPMQELVDEAVEAWLARQTDC